MRKRRGGNAAAWVGGAFALCVLGALGVLAGCSRADGAGGVVATIFPLYDFARVIVGDTAEARLLISGEVDAHAYEPSASDVRLVGEAEVFVTLGLGFEELEGQIFAAAGGGAARIDAAAGVSLLAVDEGEEHGEGEGEEGHEEGEDENEEGHEEGHEEGEDENEEGHEEGHEEGEDEEGHEGDFEHGHEADTHVWLSLDNAGVMTRNIAAGLGAVYPQYADVYAARARSYLDELTRLEGEFRTGLGNCEKEVIIATHDAYRYLARDYHFRVIAIHGQEPGAEPSFGRLARLIEEARSHGVGHVFYEAAVDRRVSETIAAEIGATLLELHPLEHASEEDTYLALMRENLANLRIALRCE